MSFKRRLGGFGNGICLSSSLGADMKSSTLDHGHQMKPPRTLNYYSGYSSSYPCDGFCVFPDRCPWQLTRKLELIEVNLLKFSVTLSYFFYIPAKNAWENIYSTTIIPSWFENSLPHPVCPENALKAHISQKQDLVDPSHLFYHSKSKTPLFPRALGTIHCAAVSNSVAVMCPGTQNTRCGSLSGLHED